MSASESRSEIVMQMAEEFLERYRQGERPSLKEYIDRHPDFAGEIRDVFPAMAMMENIALDDASLEGGQTSEVSKTPEVSLQQLGDFRIIREVGRGGMGVVYEAEQVSLGRHVALKVLPQKALLDAKHKRRFEREAKSAAKLHHTNIVPIFGVGEHDGLPYYVMQFIQGLGLDEVMDELKRLQPVSGSETGGELRVSRKDGPAAEAARSLLTGQFQGTMDFDDSGDSSGEPGASATGEGANPPLAVRPPVADAPGSESSAAGRLSDSFTLSSSSVTLPGQSGDTHQSKVKKQTYWQSVAQVGVQVADALEYAHKQGILHRDIKPSNLLLDTRGTVWVTDFGLAKADDQQNITHTGDILGTLRYMPPEAFEGKTDPRSDLYSLGLSLYELLAMQPAFDEKDRNKLIKQVMSTEAARLDRLNQAIPRDLVTVVHKAIDHEPGKRYQTAAELAADLHRFIDDEPIKARRLGLQERAWRWCRRNPVVAGLSAALVLLLVGVTVASLVAAGHFDRMAQKEAQNADNERQLRNAADEAKEQESVLRQEAQEASKKLEASLKETEAERQRAEANLAKYRQAVRAYITAVNNYITAVGRIQILKYPFLREGRRELFRLALDSLYQEFLKDHQDNPVMSAGLASAYLRVGKIHAESGDHDAARAANEEALKFYEVLARKSPDDRELKHDLAECHHTLGLYQMTLGKLEEAKEALTKALAIRQKLPDREPKNVLYRKELAETLLTLGDLHWKGGRLREGVQAHRRSLDVLDAAVRDDPKNVALQSQYAAARKVSAEAYVHAGLWKEAAQQFREYLKLQPELGYTQSGAGCVMLLGDDAASYCETCKVLLERFGKSNNPYVLGRLAFDCCLASPAEFDAARLAQWSEKAAESPHGFPEKAWSDFALGLAYLRAGQFQKAVAMASENTKKYSGWAAWPLNLPVLAMAYHRLGQAAEAEKYLGKTKEEWQGRSPLARQIDSQTVTGTHLPWWPDWTTFELLFREASVQITGAPPFAEAYYQVHRGWLYSRLGEKEKAEAEFAAAAALGLKDSSLLLTRARLFAQVGQHGRFEADIAKAVEVNPKDPRPWIERGRYLAERGRHKEADADFAKAAALSPDELNRFIQAGWWLVGPFPATLEMSCPPENHPDPSKEVAGILDGTGTSAWKSVPTGDSGFVDFLPVCKGDNRSGYALTYVYCLKESQATLMVLPDDIARVWLNGELVADNLAYGVTHRIPVTFGAGRNKLLVKVVNFPGPHSMTFRIADSPLDRGETYAELGLWDEAAVHYSRAFAQTAPPSPHLERMWVLLQVMAGDDKGYRNNCRRIIERYGDSKNWDDLFAVALACSLDGKLTLDGPRLVEVTETAHRGFGGNPTYKALAHYRAGQIEKALRSLNELPKDKDSKVAWVVRAMAHHRLGQKDEASRWLTKASEWYDKATREASGPRIPTFYSDSWWDQAQFQLLYLEALRQIEGPEARDRNRETLQGRARKALSKETYDYDLAILLQPDQPRLYLARGRRLVELKRTKEAAADFAKAVAIKPADAQVWKERGRMYADLGQLDNAAADFAKTLELRPKDSAWLPRVFHFDLVPRKDMLAKVIQLRPQDEELRALVKAVENNLRDSGPAGVVVAGNLLTNGSFEDGPDPGAARYVIHRPGSNTLPGWAVASGNVDVELSASHGARCLDLHGDTAGGIVQSFVTVPGQRYRVTFDLAGNPNLGPKPAIKKMRLAAAGKSADFEFDITGRTPQDLGWVSKSWEFTALKASTTLELYSLDASGIAGPFLDNVAVVAVGKE